MGKLPRVYEFEVADEAWTHLARLGPRHSYSAEALAGVRDLVGELVASLGYEFEEPPLPQGSTGPLETLARFRGWRDALEALELQERVLARFGEANAAAEGSRVAALQVIDRWQGRVREAAESGQPIPKLDAPTISASVESIVRAVLWNGMDLSARHASQVGPLHHYATPREGVVWNAIVARDAWRLCEAGVYHLALMRWSVRAVRRVPPLEYVTRIKAEKVGEGFPRFRSRLDGIATRGEKLEGVDSRVPSLVLLLASAVYGLAPQDEGDDVARSLGLATA